MVNVWDDDEKLKEIEKAYQTLEESRGNGIVYFSLIRILERFSEALRKRKIPHHVYHGDLRPGYRKQIQNESNSTDPAFHHMRFVPFRASTAFCPAKRAKFSPPRIRPNFQTQNTLSCISTKQLSNFPLATHPQLQPPTSLPLDIKFPRHPLSSRTTNNLKSPKTENVFRANTI